MSDQDKAYGKFGTILFVILWSIYSIGGLATFVHLVIEDMPGRGFFTGAVLVVCDIGLSIFWPVYWGVLRWIFG